MITLVVSSTALTALILTNVQYGVPLGGDWGFPATVAQGSVIHSESLSSIGRTINPFGNYQIHYYPTALFWYLVTKTADIIGWEHAVNIVTLGPLLMMGAFCYILVRRVSASFFSGLVSAILISTSALVFNYMLMGWYYALISLSLIPLCLWCYIRGLDGSRIHLIVSGVIFALTPIQSQGMIWCFLCLLTVATTHFFINKNLWDVVKSLAFVLLLCIVGNAYWFPTLLFYPPSYIASSDIVSSSVSLGTMVHYNFFNSLRLWGSLYNYQFESIQTSAGLSIYSYFAPVLAIIGLMTSRSPYKWAFALLMLSPVVLMFLGNNRDLLVAIPFANAFRDLPRFSVLSLLGTSVLAGLGAGNLFQWTSKRWGKIGGAGVVILVVTGLAGATYPWWSGEMTNWQATNGPDFRLRFKEFPESYVKLEGRLAKERLLQKAMYYPLGGTVSFKDDVRFLGLFKETQDIYAIYSPIPGVVAMSDRKFGAIDEIMKRLANETPNCAQLNVLADSGVRLFIFRRNLLGQYPTPSDSLVNEMVDSGAWFLWFEDKEIVAYAAKRFKPAVFTTPSTNDYHEIDTPTTEFRKINPTLYRVRIHNVHEPISLVLNETYNEHWRLAMDSSDQRGIPLLAARYTELNKSDGAASRADVDAYVAAGWITLPESATTFNSVATDKHSLGFVSSKNEGTIQNDNLPNISPLEVLKMTSVANDSHVTVNGFANAWSLDPATVCKEPNSCLRGEDGKLTLDLVIEFVPQRVFNIGGIVTLATYIILLLYVIYYGVRMLNARISLS